MSCSVCYEDKKLLRCPCGASTCESCQTQYGVPACPACASAYSLSMLKKQAPKLVAAVYKPHHERAFWEREKALLPNTQLLVDWEVKTEELKKQLRFGLRPQLPPKPMMSLSSMLAQVFPCPSSECRGFVQGKRCGSCKLEVCIRCRERDGAEHRCDETAVQSIVALEAETKACPRCAARIFKTQGCNHMFCTHCRTHFDWMTGKITQQSTNHHYDNTRAFADNVAMRTMEGGRDPCGEADISIDAVRLADVPPAARQLPLFRLLWLEARQARQMHSSLYDPRKIMDAHDAGLIQLRLNFLRNKLDEKQVKSKIYNLELQLQKKTESERLLRIFLTTINDMQRIWRDGGFGANEKLVALFDGLLEVAETSSIALQEEYGGQRILFRKDWRLHDEPVVTLHT